MTLLFIIMINITYVVTATALKGFIIRLHRKSLIVLLKNEIYYIL